PPAPPLFPSGLCRSCGRTLSQTRWLATHLSHRPTLAHPSTPVARTHPTQTRHSLGDSQTQDAAYLQPRWSSRFGCRHLNLTWGGHFIVAVNTTFYRCIYRMRYDKKFQDALPTGKEHAGGGRIVAHELGLSIMPAVTLVVNGAERKT